VRDVSLDGVVGTVVIVEELLFKPPHGLIDQSLRSRLGVETTNGDGFGLGWYGAGQGPGVYRNVAPAWGDANPGNPRLQRLRDEDRLVVSEPLTDLPGIWQDGVPAS
jgi:predicted glutamine amidotransferase